MSLAVVLSRGLAGLDAPLVTVEVHLGRRAAGLQSGRPARHRGQGIARSRACGDAERAVRVPGAQDHRQPGACGSAQGVRAFRSADRPWRARRDAADTGQHTCAIRVRGRARARRCTAPHPRRDCRWHCPRCRDGRAFVLPAESAAEAALVRGATVLPATSLLAVCAHLTGREPLVPLAPQVRVAGEDARGPDLADVRGQEHAKRALTIAAAGAHSLLMIGPPGTGKSMLAQRLPGILPPLSEDEALAAAAIASLAGRFASSGMGVAALSRAAPYGKRRRAGRRRQRPPARRNLARPPRSPVPRRVAGVGSPRARGAAPAARVRGDPYLARRTAEHLSRRVPVRRRDESLSLRLAWPRERALPLHAGSHRALSRPGLRAAHRSHRPGHRGAGARAGGADRR